MKQYKFKICILAIIYSVKTWQGFVNNGFRGRLPYVKTFFQKNMHSTLQAVIPVYLTPKI